MIEPTYLRYVYDKLNQKSLSSDNASNLPYGFIEIYEKSFQSNISINYRYKIISKLTIWALMFEPMSIESVSKLYGCNVVEMKIIIDKFSTWFNVLENGNYEIYHQRLKLFILQKVSQKELIALANKILTCLHTNLNTKQNNQIVNYAYKYIHVYFEIYSTYIKKDNEVYKTISSKIFWDKQIKITGNTKPTLNCLSFLVKESIQKENIEKTITYLLNYSSYSIVSKNKENIISYSFTNSDYKIILDEIKTFDNETKLKIYFSIIDHIVLKKQKDYFELIVKIIDEIINNPELNEINWLKFQSQKILYSHFKYLAKEGFDISILWKNCQIEIIEEFEIEFLEKLIDLELNTYDYYRVRLRILELKSLIDNNFINKNSITLLVNYLEHVEYVNNKYLFNEFEIELTSEKERYNIIKCKCLIELCGFLLKIKSYNFLEDVLSNLIKIPIPSISSSTSLNVSNIYLNFLIQTSNPQNFLEKYNQDKFSLFDNNKRIIAPLEKYIHFYIDSKNEEYFVEAFNYLKTISIPQNDFGVLIRLYVRIIEYFSIEKKLNSIKKYFIEFDKLIKEVDYPKLTYYIPKLIEIFYNSDFKNEIKNLEKEYFKRIKIKSYPNYDYVNVLQSNFELYKSYLNIGDIKKANFLIDNYLYNISDRFKASLIRLEYDYNEHKKINSFLNDIIKLKNIYEDKLFDKSENYNLILNGIKENLLKKNKIKDYFYLCGVIYTRPKQKPIRFRGSFFGRHLFSNTYIESALNDLKKKNLNLIEHKKSLIKSKYLTLKIKVKEIEYLINNSFEFNEVVEHFYKSLEGLNFDFQKVELNIKFLEVLISSNQFNLFTKYFDEFVIYINGQKKNFELISDLSEIHFELYFFALMLFKHNCLNEKELIIKSLNSLKTDIIDSKILNDLTEVDFLFNKIVLKKQYKFLAQFYNLLIPLYRSCNHDIIYYFKYILDQEYDKEDSRLLNYFDKSAKKLIIQKLRNESKEEAPWILLYFISEKSLRSIIGEIKESNLSTNWIFSSSNKSIDFKAKIIEEFLNINYQYLQRISYDKKVFLQILKLNYLNVHSELSTYLIEKDLMAYFTCIDPFQLNIDNKNFELFKSIYNFRGHLK